MSSVIDATFAWETPGKGKVKNDTEGIFAAQVAKVRSSDESTPKTEDDAVAKGLNAEMKQYLRRASPCRRVHPKFVSRIRPVALSFVLISGRPWPAMLKWVINEQRGGADSRLRGHTHTGLGRPRKLQATS